MNYKHDTYVAINNKIEQHQVLSNISKWSNYYKLSLLIGKILYLHTLTVGNESLTFDADTKTMFQDVETEILRDTQGVSTAFVQSPNIANFLIDPSKLDDILVEELPQFTQKIRNDINVFLKTLRNLEPIHLMDAIIKKLSSIDVEQSEKDYRQYTPRYDLTKMLPILETINNLCVVSAEGRNSYQCVILEQENHDDQTGQRILDAYIELLKKEVLPILTELNINCIINSKFYDLITVAPFTFVPQPSSSTIDEQGLSDPQVVRSKFIATYTKVVALFQDATIMGKGFGYLDQIDKSCTHISKEQIRDTFFNLVRYSQILKANMVVMSLVIEDILQQSKPLFEAYLRTLNTTFGA
jgi:hypothetical protein